MRAVRSWFHLVLWCHRVLGVIFLFYIYTASFLGRAQNNMPIRTRNWWREWWKPTKYATGERISLQLTWTCSSTYMPKCPLHQSKPWRKVGAPENYMYVFHSDSYLTLEILLLSFGQSALIQYTDLTDHKELYYYSNA